MGKTACWRDGGQAGANRGGGCRLRAAARPARGCCTASHASLTPAPPLTPPTSRLPSPRPVVEHASGICRIVPPAEWVEGVAKDFSINRASLKFNARVQRVDQLQRKHTAVASQRFWNEYKVRLRVCWFGWVPQMPPNWGSHGGGGGGGRQGRRDALGCAASTLPTPALALPPPASPCHASPVASPPPPPCCRPGWRPTASSARAAS